MGSTVVNWICLEFTNWANLSPWRPLRCLSGRLPCRSARFCRGVILDERELEAQLAQLFYCALCAFISVAFGCFQKRRSFFVKSFNSLQNRHFSVLGFPSHVRLLYVLYPLSHTEG